MSIYLIRHTTPQVAKGICYGQSDIGVTETFLAEAAQIKAALPEEITLAYSSPLSRCYQLAAFLFPTNNIIPEPGLMELNCGEWEGLHWDAIPKEAIDPWMKDFINISMPGGESYMQMHARVTECFMHIAKGTKPVAIVTHGGVIRSILAHITQTPLKDSFGAFPAHYGCVMRLTETNSGFHREVLHNIPTEKEQHKPSGFRKS